MASLYDSNDTLITDRVSSVMPGYDVIKVTNRLLDGSYHVQTIGTAARIVTATFTVTSETTKDTVDLADAQATLLKVTGSSKYYTGIIKDTPSWDRLAPGIYRTTITLLVSEEGAV
jgi:hypothetical protein